ncbi:hypothetical protein GRF59_05575 [Paenibacillus sp. HJL G12]|uniref:Uncharacterized protein n=2 Tax=Paenibacillus dendrobii TaxID=2691084 RepID=A0A7X3IFR8_9BACL|nr:hypothetical protein [Paenibacillus dendrobii]
MLDNQQNFMNANEVFPIIDLIRRELNKQGLYAGSGDDLSVIDRILPNPEVLNVEAFREMQDYPALVTKVVYTYDNGTIEKLSIQRDESLLIYGFLIEIEGRSLVNEELEAETDITSFRTIQGTLIRENGLFKNLKLEYTRAV